jgi:hypothetical protein
MIVVDDFPSDVILRIKCAEPSASLTDMFAKKTATIIVPVSHIQA